MNTRKLPLILLALAFLCLAGLVWSACATTYYVDSSSNVTGTLTSGTFISGEYVVQATSGAVAKLVGTCTASPMVITDINGSPDASHTWTGQSSSAVFTPSGSPSANGSDSNNGTSTGTPWATMAAVNGASPVAGSSLLFKCGDVWRATLTVPTSGSSGAGNTITFGNYGSGANPVICGANLITGAWSALATWTTVATIGVGGDGSRGDSDDFNVRQVLGTFASGGTQIRVTVVAPATHNGNITAMKIGPRGSTSSYASAPTAITFGGNPNITLVAGNTYVSDAISFTSDTLTTYMFSIWSYENGRCSFVSSGQTSYYKAVTGGTGSDDSSNLTVSGYTTDTFGYEVSKVEVYNATANVWTTALTTQPLAVLFNRTLGVNKTSVGNLTNNGDWYWASNVLNVRSSTNPGTAYTNPGVEAHQRDNGIYVLEKNYVTVNGLHCLGAKVGILSQAYYNPGSYITIQSCEAELNQEAGIELRGHDAGDSLTYMTVTNNAVHDNMQDGIGGYTYGSYWTISYNNVYNNTNQASAASPPNSGIHIVAATGAAPSVDRPKIQYVTVEHNNIYNNGTLLAASNNNGGNGCHFDTISNSIFRYNLVHGNNTYAVYIEKNQNTQVYYNLVYNNGGYQFSGAAASWGIGVVNSGFSNQVYNNVVYGTLGEGIKCAAAQGAYDPVPDFTNNIIKNNISIGNTTYQLSAYWGGENDGTDGTGNVYTYNCFGSETSNFIQWGLGVYKSTYATWNSATGAGAGVTDHYVNGGPAFVSTTTPDFHLTSASPCIYAGVNVGLTQDYDGRPVPIGSVPEIGAYSTTRAQGNFLGL